MCPAEEDISLVVMADMSPRTFWEFAVEKLDLEPERTPRTGGQTLNIDINDIQKLHQVNAGNLCEVKLKLGFCRTPREFSSSPLIAKFMINGDPAMARIYEHQNLTTQLFGEDTESADLDLFRMGFLHLRQWARSTGILSSELKMLDTECLLWMYSTAYLTLRTQQNDESGVDSLLKQMFEIAAFEQFFSSDISDCRMTVMTPGGRNAAFGISREGVQAILTAMDRLSGRCWALGTFELTKSPSEGFTLFRKEFDLMIRVEGRCWVAKRRAMVKDNLLNALLGLQRHIYHRSKRAYEAHIWPFSLSDETGNEDGDLEYVLGLHSTTAMDHPSMQREAGELVESFMHMLDYDAESVFIQSEVITESTFDSIVNKEKRQSYSSSSINSTPSPPAAGAPKKAEDVKRKFRTATSAMNRLHWDPKHGNIDYEVGYVDRFEDGLIWKQLEKWEKMTEEEEFVPEHRIRQIRRKADKEVVWDRVKRWDGTGEPSGISAGKESS